MALPPAAFTGSLVSATPPSGGLVELPTALAALPITLDHVSAGIEIALLFSLFYVLLLVLHGTRGLAVLKGVSMIIFAVSLALVGLHLFFGLYFPRLWAAGTELLPAVFVVLVILFQPELRTGFTRLSERYGSVEAPRDLAGFADSICRLGKARIGALVVFEQQTGLQDIESSGVALDAALTGPLIENLFQPKAPLHDGALLVRHGRIVAASCVLPLTESDTIARELGTRHRAAIGVTESTDALAVIVSEETGRVSIVSRGLLHRAEDADSLLVMLADMLQGYEGHERVVA